MTRQEANRLVDGWTEDTLRGTAGWWPPEGIWAVVLPPIVGSVRPGRDAHLEAFRLTVKRPLASAVTIPASPLKIFRLYCEAWKAYKHHQDTLRLHEEGLLFA